MGGSSSSSTSISTTASTRPRLKDFYPGDSYVDMNVITTYNRDGTDKYHTSWETFRGNFTDAYTQVKDMSSRPIGIAEMSSTSYGGDKAQWITDAFAAIASTDFKRVVEVTWFDENKTVDGVLSGLGAKHPRRDRRVPGRGGTVAQPGRLRQPLGHVGALRER